jgi:hypothetical protein
MSDAAIGIATSMIGIGASPESSVGARGEAPAGEAEAFARVLAAIEGEIAIEPATLEVTGDEAASIAAPTIAIAPLVLPTLEVEAPVIDVERPMIDVEGEPPAVETEIASTPAAAAMPAPLLGTTTIPSHDASTVSPPPRNETTTRISATGDVRVDAPEPAPAMPIESTAPAATPTIVARTSHGDPQAPVVEHATMWTATPEAATPAAATPEATTTDVELATPIDAPPSSAVAMRDASAPEVREDDAPAPIDVAPVIATPLPIPMQPTLAVPVATDEPTEAAPVPDAKSVAATPIAAPVESMLREAAVTPPLPKAPVAIVTPSLEMPTPTLVDAMTPSPTAPEIHTPLESTATTPEPTPTASTSPIDRAPADVAMKAPIVLSRAEDLAAAIDQLRPIPRGGATLEVEAPGLGAIRMHVAVDGDTVKIRIHAGAEALGWFAREHDGLCSAARQAVPESQSVDLQLHTGSEGRGQSQSQSHARNYTADGGDPSPQRPRPLAPRHDAATTTTATSPTSSRSLVDVLA